MALRFTALFLVATRNSKVQNGNAISNFIFEIKYTWNFRRFIQKKTLETEAFKTQFFVKLIM